MHPAQFVNLLFIYAGVLLIIQASLGFGSGWQLNLQSVSNAILGLIIMANAPVRMRNPIEQQTPSEYGPFVYVFVALCFVLTVITIGMIWLGIA